jgi:GxxExxY protein
MKTQLIFEEESYRIRGACFEVYKEKGCGFSEAIYQECLVAEMQIQEIPCDPQYAIPLTYKGRVLTHRFIPDLICFGKIIVELKAVSAIVDEHRSQLMNYLHATGMRLGFLVNFGHHPMIQIERFAN